ncbi:histidine kinase [Actinomadura mexicana]|uniref:Histidine kinase n=1 Tax=Actinomadura mexicana TaxID=134959 RepID=A0A239BX58_9ACTN|nr:histidine kinase [Actinomadura mexicana]SNS11654.1 Histidine kinase [Actinomadura mexicana]
MTCSSPAPGLACGSRDGQRIGHDLADQITCRLFGIGLELNGALALIQDPQATRRVRAALTGLDDAIDDLRRVVFDLHTAPGDPGAFDR